MERQDISPIRAAASMGFLMGLFWLLKYLLVVYGSSSANLSSIYMGLTIMVPYAAFKMTQGYRAALGADRPFTFSRAWLFGFFVYLFAGLLVSVLHFYYFKFVMGSEGIAIAFAQTVEVAEMLGLDAGLLQQLRDFGSPTPIQMTMQAFLNNLVGGAILSIPVALFTRRA